MAQKLYSSQIPDSFRGLLSNSKVVQDSILERTEKKISLLEGRPSISLYSKTGSPPSLNNELDISSPNFIALSESFFIVKMRYTVKDNLNANPGEYKNWICPTSPAFSWFKNVRVELDGIEVTQSSKVPDMQIVQHVLRLMESSVAKLQYSDSDLYGLQKLDPRKSLKRVPLASYEYGGKRRRGYAFASNNNDDDAVAPDFKGNFSLKRAPTVALDTFDGYSNTVLENVVRVLSGQFQYKLRPFLPFFNVDDSWVIPNTQIKISFDLPQTELSRYMILSDLGGGANNAASVGEVKVELLQLDFVYPTYRMSKTYVDQVRLAKELYFHTWCPRLVQKSITDDAGTLELLHNADIPRRMILFFSDLNMGKDPALDAKKGDSSNRLAMIHANLSQLRLTVNDDSVFDSPLKFNWQCSEGEPDVKDAKTYYYDYNKSSYLRGYNLVQEFFGKTYGTEIPITAGDYCNNYFMIPINLNLHRQIDNEKIRGNLSIDYQFTDVQNSPIKLPSDATTSIKVNLLCLDQYLFTFDKEKGIKSEVV